MLSASRVVQHRLLHIVFASTSGNTEYVVDTLIDFLQSSALRWQIERSMAERTQPKDLLRGDALLLACGTWNTGGNEGNLNRHMWALLRHAGKAVDLAGKPCACIGLGDHRYFYTAHAADLLQRCLENWHGRLLLPVLRVIDEPYGQDQFLQSWAQQLVRALQVATRQH